MWIKDRIVVGAELWRILDGSYRLRVDCDRLTWVSLSVFLATNDAYHDAGRRFVWIARGFVSADLFEVTDRMNRWPVARGRGRR